VSSLLTFNDVLANDNYNYVLLTLALLVNLCSIDHQRGCHYNGQNARLCGVSHNFREIGGSIRDLDIDASQD
jgi:hypothetical protein